MGSWSSGGVASSLYVGYDEIATRCWVKLQHRRIFRKTIWVLCYSYWNSFPGCCWSPMLLVIISVRSTPARGGWGSAGKFCWVVKNSYWIKVPWGYDRYEFSWFTWRWAHFWYKTPISTDFPSSPCSSKFRLPPHYGTPRSLTHQSLCTSSPIPKWSKQ